MKGIIKSQFYQLRRERLLIIIFVLLLAFMLLQAFLISGMSDYRTTDMYLVNNNFSMLFIALAFPFAATGFMCGSDFSDKTLNYEVMSGHLRYQIYFGRVIPCLIVSVLGFLVLIFAPVLQNTLMHGWGTEIRMDHMLIRIALMAFPVLRLSCMAVLITFFCKNRYILVGIGCMCFMIFELLLMIMDVSQAAAEGVYSGILSYTNLTMLFTIDSWQTYGLDGDTNYIFESALSCGEIVSTVVCSLIFSAIFLGMGYVFFKNDDLN